MSDENKMPAVHHGAWIGPAPTSEEIGLTRPKENSSDNKVPTDRSDEQD